MRPHGRIFDGSSSLFETQRVLRKSIVNGHMVWPIHTCKSVPSDFRPVTTSDVLFARYMSRP